MVTVGPGSAVCGVCSVAVSAARSDPGTAADDYIPGQHCSTQHRSSRVISYAAEHAAVSPAEHLVTSAVAPPSTVTRTLSVDTN